MTEAHEFDLLVIGSGPSGQRAAVQAAKLGRRVGLIERRRGVGGVSLYLGTIPSKTFREAVMSVRGEAAMQAMEIAGIDPVRPTMEMLVRRVEHVMAEEGRVIRDQLLRNDVTLISGSASFVDPHTLLIEGLSGERRITASCILIATGTRARVPPGCSADGSAIFTSDDLVSLRTLPRSLIVVGGGVIGVEYASMFARLGTQVTLVEAHDKPISFMDHETVDEFMHELRSRKVIFRCGEAVSCISVQGADGAVPRAVVELESGKRLTGDCVLVSAGRQGAVEGLNLEAAGLSASARGLLTVDHFFRTSVPHIYATGDIIGFPALAATSAEQGRIAACHMFGEPVASIGDRYPIGIYAIPELSAVGATEEQLTKDKVPYEIGVARYAETARGQISGASSGFLKLLFHRVDRSLLGVHICGASATELVHIGQAVMGLGGGLDYLMSTVFNYPTFAECYKMAALNAANKLRAE
jgi:NAD(P) transhydrogenase